MTTGGPGGGRGDLLETACFRRLMAKNEDAMITLRRVVVLAMFAAVVLGLGGGPVNAASGDVEALVYLRNLTLPAGGDAVEEDLTFLLFADRAGRADEVTLDVDVSGLASVAEVEVTGLRADVECSAGPVVRCVVPGPHQVYPRPEGDGGFVFLTEVLVSMSLTPKAGAAVGDSGVLTVAAKADDGPAMTDTATVRLGEALISRRSTARSGRLLPVVRWRCDHGYATPGRRRSTG
jgi:hypothetical protein